MRLTDKQRLEVEYNMGKHDGMKGVVEWINERHRLGYLSHCGFLHVWQAKLKEWGLR